MDQKVFAEYLEKRYHDQINYYERASGKNQKKYKNYQWLLIILSTLTTILAALPEAFYLKYVVVVTAGLVTIFTAALKTFQYQELWTNYRSTIEDLKPEWYYYLFNIKEHGYGAEGIDNETKFVENVETILKGEHKNWSTKMNSANSKQQEELQNLLDKMIREKFKTQRTDPSNVTTAVETENSVEVTGTDKTEEKTTRQTNVESTETETGDDKIIEPEENTDEGTGNEKKA